jgi:hypothetical protein
MKKRSFVIFTALLMIWTCLCPLLTIAAETENDEFLISDGILLGYYGYDKEVEVPYGVTEISGIAFNNKQLSRVTLPDTVKIIDSYAFNGKDITEIELPDGLETIGQAAFAGTKLKSISIPDSVTAIEDYTFQKTPLQEIKLPKNLKSIGYLAFAYTDLTEIDIPYGVTEINESAFYFSQKLTKATLSDTVKKIGNLAFSGTMLEEINLPESLTDVAINSFSNTPFIYSLKKKNGGWLILSNGRLVSYVGDDVNAVMPDTVKTIGSKAFLNRVRMQSLTIPNSVKVIEDTPFLNCTPRRIYSTNPLAEKLLIPCFSSPDIPPEKGSYALDLSADTWQISNDKEFFGDTYCFTDTALTQLKEQLPLQYQTFDDPWEGSCYGLVLTVLLVKNAMLSVSDIMEGAETLSEIKASPDVLSVINYYHFLQYTEAAQKLEKHAGIYELDYFDQIISLGWQAQKEGKPFLFSFDTGDGGHTCAGCGIESGKWKWNGKDYDRRIILWDPNIPTEYRDDICLYYRENDYDYCIPYYNVSYAYDSLDNTGKIKAASDLLNVLGEPEYPFSHKNIKGDVNSDNSFDIADLVTMQKWLLGKGELADSSAGDLMADGTINIFDMIMMRKLLIEKSVTA